MRLCLYLFFMSLCVFRNAVAKDLGVWGAHFTIKEEGFIEMINRRLKNIDFDKENKKMVAIGQKRINEPQAIIGITKTKEARIFSFDPSYITQEEINISSGEMIIPIGTKINPLDHMNFDRKIFFIDARDEDQVKWLEAEMNTKIHLQESRIILVGGSPLQLMDKLWKIGYEDLIYFDQSGEITDKLGIKHVPAIMVQNIGEKVLTIEEVVCYNK